MRKKILYIDDDLQTGWARLKDTEYEFVEKAPTDFDTDSEILAALHGKNIVLMDYKLHDSEDTPSVPIDGIELLERFRAVIRHHQHQGDQVPLLTIYTGKLEELIKDFGCPSAPHLVARQANVDWVFEKGKPRIGTEITRHRLDAIISGFEFKFRKNETDGEDQLFSFLKLPEDLPWTDLAKVDVRVARSPTQAINNANSCATLMRWLLQVALPIRGCFVDLPWIATSLHMRPKEFSDALRDKPNSKFSKLLSEYRYKGALADFYSEERYWRAGINYLVWKFTEGLSPLNSDVRDSLSEAIGKEIPVLNERHPVLLVDLNTFQETSQVFDLDYAVQVQPDFWPAGVDLPWVKRSDAEDDQELWAIVISEDRERLPGDLF